MKRMIPAILRSNAPGLAVVLLVASALSSAVHAQPSTGASGIEAFHVIYHDWQPATPIGNDSSRVTHVQQLAVPLNFRFGQTRRVSFDISGGGAMSRVTVRHGDSTSVLQLNGPTDVRALMTITAAREHLALLLGGTAPSGLTKLSPTQISALGVLAAPAVQTPVPAFGGGAGGNAGATLTMPVGLWAITAGGAYERRFRYEPFSELVVGTPVAASIAPGAVLSFSGRVDGEVAGTALMFDMSVRQFYADTFAIEQDKRTVRSVYRLGPLTNLAVRVQPTTRKARDVVFTAAIQKRAPYELLDRGKVPNSGASLLSASVAGTLLRAGGFRIAAGIEKRSYSGIKADSSLVAAAFSELAGSVNFVIPLSGGEFVITTAGSTGSVTLRNKPAVSMRRFTVHAQMQAF